MPIVVTCTNCDKKLRVPDDLLGKKVKCPGCGTIFLGKVADSPSHKDKPPTSVRSKERAPPKEEPEDDEEQSEKTTGGVQSKPSQKGSRPKDDDDDEPPERPSRKGKKADEDDDDEDDRPSKRRKRKDDDDDDDDDDDRPSRRRRPSDDDDDDDDDDRPSRRRSRRRNYQAHRGVLVMVLGIVSIVCGIVICCWPLALFGGLGFGIPSWILGQMDRRKMAGGEMDPAGHGMTTAGWICGIVGCSLGALQIFCMLLRVVGFAGANAFDNFGG